MQIDESDVGKVGIKSLSVREVMHLLRLGKRLARLILPEKNCQLLDITVHLLVLLLFLLHVDEKKTAQLGS